MNTVSARKMQQMSSEQLRRARGLYAVLCEKAIYRSPQLIFICAQRAQARGLYSAKTGYRDVVWHFVRRLWRIDSSRGKNRVFNDFQKDSGLWAICDKEKQCWKYPKLRKPVIRIRA